MKTTVQVEALYIVPMLLSLVFAPVNDKLNQLNKRYICAMEVVFISYTY